MTTTEHIDQLKAMRAKLDVLAGEIERIEQIVAELRTLCAVPVECPCTSHDSRECIEERFPINQPVNVVEVCGCECHKGTA